MRPSNGGPPSAGPSAPGAPPGWASAQQQIERLYADAEFLTRYQSPNREVGAAATAEMTGLSAAAYPPEPPSAGNGAAAGGAGAESVAATEETNKASLATLTGQAAQTAAGYSAAGSLLGGAGSAADSLSRVDWKKIFP